ncbi:MAG: hypothetical protein QM811_25800 [Pirellulales bacterium]
MEGAKTTYPAKALDAGVKTLVGALEACHDLSDKTASYTVNDLRESEKGEHVRFVFPKPVNVRILNETLPVSEAVFADGTFLLLCTDLSEGPFVLRATKYEHKAFDAFQTWTRQTLPADR